MAINLRQLGFCDPRTLNEKIRETTIIGAGGIGSTVAMALSKMGLRNMTVWDEDTLEEHNLGNQFLPYDCLLPMSSNFLGRKKVESLEFLIDTLLPDPSVEYEPVNFDWRLDHYTYLTICTVDSMSTREKLWTGAKRSEKCRWYIDGRMGAQTLRIYVVDKANEEDITAYEDTLYTDDEAVQEPCTARGIIYTSLFAGAHIANIVRQIAVGPQQPPRQLIHMIEHNQLIEVKR